MIKVGIMPASPFSAGDIVVISKSGTLLYEISNSLTQAGFGQSITIGVGGDPVNGTRLVDAFDVAKDLPGLRGIVIVGEIGGDAEEIIAQRKLIWKADGTDNIVKLCLKVWHAVGKINFCKNIIMQICKVAYSKWTGWDLNP